MKPQKNWVMVKVKIKVWVRSMSNDALTINQKPYLYPNPYPKPFPLNPWLTKNER
jgi:hypothetical protein